MSEGPNAQPDDEAVTTKRVPEAAALIYEPGTRAPRVVASGKHVQAQQIIDAARQAGVPVRFDPALATALAALQIEAEIPPELYRAVAEALAWAYRIDGKLAARLPS